MRAELYSPARSPLHRLHPAAKLVGLLVLFLVALAFNDPLWVLPLFVFSLGLVGLARGWEGLRRIGPLALWLAVVAAILWGVLLRAGESATLGPITYYPQSLVYGAGAGLRLATIIFFGLALVVSTRVEEIGEGLRCLGAPRRFCLAVALVFRLVPLFVEVSFRVREAQRARGYAPAAHTRLGALRQYPPLIIPVMSYAMRRVEAMALALEARGISRPGPRTSYLARPLRLPDALVVVFLLALAVLCVSLRAFGYGAVLPRI